MTRSVSILLALVLLAACGESEEVKSARRDAQRTSCIAQELALQAKERLAKLDTTVAASQGSPMEQVTLAAHRFASALKERADAFALSAAYQDSAASARSSEDSVRYAGLATQHRPGAPAAGTVEGNVAERYAQDLAAAFGNPDHPCNNPEEEG